MQPGTWLPDPQRGPHTSASSLRTPPQAGLRIQAGPQTEHPSKEPARLACVQCPACASTMHSPNAFYSRKSAPLCVTATPHWAKTAWPSKEFRLQG